MNDSNQNRLDWLDEKLARLDRHGLRRRRIAHAGPQTASIMLDGRQLVNFGSNDYLGLAADPRLAAAAIEATEHEGWGSGASPLITGWADAHRRLEQQLAELEETEAAILFPSGFAANAGTIPALATQGDAIYSDAKNHASIVDGCRLSRADVHVYPHADTSALESLLAEGSSYRRRLIVTDGLFSMDGDLAPLQPLADLAERFDCMLMVDEAHATGVFGRQGRGVAEHLGVERRVDIRIGTLSKALGSAGGFVAGRQSLIDWLVNRARSYVFSTAQPAATSAAALAALAIVQSEPERRSLLLERAAELRQSLRSRGWDVGASESQIIPILIGKPDRAMQLAASLAERGFYVPGIRPPSVPAGESLLRLSLSYAHTPEMIQGLTDALAALAD